MPTGSGPADSPLDVSPPAHPLHAMTTFELRDHRRDLEAAIAFASRSGSVSPERASLQARLDDLLAEQADRQKLADA
jgi:hypothetical protein